MPGMITVNRSGSSGDTAKFLGVPENNLVKTMGIPKEFTEQAAIEEQKRLQQEYPAKKRQAYQASIVGVAGVKTSETAGPDVTKWFAEDLVAQLKYRKTYVNARDQWPNKLAAECPEGGQRLAAALLHETGFEVEKHTDR